MRPPGAKRLLAKGHFDLILNGNSKTPSIVTKQKSISMDSVELNDAKY